MVSPVADRCRSCVPFLRSVILDPSFEMLVPDSRMIPVVGPGLATTLVRRLLEGSIMLDPQSYGLDGVDLNIDAVLVDAGVAQVDLDASAQLADDASRQALSRNWSGP